jgi:hypothetical protein
MLLRMPLVGLFVGIDQPPGLCYDALYAVTTGERWGDGRVV